MAEQNQQASFITPELTHRIELILHLLEYSNKLVIVKGEPDSGKTTFCNELKQQQESNLVIRSLTVTTNSKLSDVYKAIIDGSSEDELKEGEYSQDDLTQWLTHCQNKQQIPALLVDNADLSDDVLINQIFDILKNSNEASTLHVCLFCESSFLERLEESGINKEDTESLHIIEMPSLSDKQTEQYIRNNYPDDNSSELDLFDDKTIKQIHRISHGLPGRINALCEQYLDDPAKQAEVIEEKPSPKTNINIKETLIKNKLVLSVVSLLLLLSVGMATLLNQTEKEDVKQTIKLELPKQNEDEEKPEEVAEVVVPPELEAEPVTIDELSPPVIADIADDLNDKTEVMVFNAQGNLVAKESDIEAAKLEQETLEQEILEQETLEEKIKEESVEVVEEELIEEKVPFIETPAITETAIEVLPEPEPEPVIEEKKSEPKPEAKPEPTVKDITWLTKQDPKKYVLQLIGAYEQETIDVYLKAFNGADDNIISFTASNKGKQWHVLIYGLYSGRDQAVAAIEDLPTKAKLMAPWPRSVQSIKDLLQ